MKGYIHTSILLSLILLLPLAGQTSKGGRWQFENNGDDTADWDQLPNNGELVQVSFGTAAPLQEGSFYLKLDAAIANDYFQVPDHGDLDFQDESIAISLWIYPLGFEDTQFLVCKGIQNTVPKSVNYALRLESGTGNLSFLIRDANNQAQVVTADFVVPVDAWTFIAAHYDFAAQQVYFWNSATASPADTQAFTQSFFPNDGPLAVGCWYTTDGLGVKHFNGRIDDLRISGRLQDVLAGTLTIAAGGRQQGVRSKGGFSLYPNPLSLSSGGPGLTIRLDAVYEPTTVVIYNLVGQEVYRKAVFSGKPEILIQWPMNQLTGNPICTGIYFIVRQNISGQVVKKFTVLK